jgi:hypothetical protein
VDDLQHGAVHAPTLSNFHGQPLHGLVNSRLS